MSRRVIAILLSLAVVGLWLVSRPAPPASESVPPVPEARTVPLVPVPTSPAAASTPPPSTKIAPPPPDRTTPRDLTIPLVPSTIPGMTPPPPTGLDPVTDIDFDKVSAMLRDYRTLFGGNPVGTNAEIMKSIMAGNPKGAMLGPPEGQSLNGENELLDRWGTPIFFHQLTADLMELRSAGPDRTLWTDDDLVR